MDPTLYLIGWKPRGEKRDLQIRLANALVKRDIILGATRYVPQHPSPMRYTTPFLVQYGRCIQHNRGRMLGDIAGCTKDDVMAKPRTNTLPELFPFASFAHSSTFLHF
jgi:hypothetical protein